MHILISEFMDERAVASLRERHDVLHDPKLVDDPAQLRREAAKADAIIVRNRTQVRGELLAALTRCRVVGRLGVGLDNIDVEACEARGKTLGLVGFGSIGQLTARLARGVGMHVIAHDALLEPADAVYRECGVRSARLDELVASADVVSLHVPLLDSTRHLFDGPRLAAMKKGAILINSARGGVVDEAALAAALRGGHLGGAALDVFEHEPLAGGSALAYCPNLLLTPHIAGVSAESNERVSSLIARKVLEALG